jgi:hypothetical protein
MPARVILHEYVCLTRHPPHALLHTLQTNTQDAFIPQDRESGRPRGFAFVTMANTEEANNAINQLNQTEFGVRCWLAERGAGARVMHCPLTASPAAEVDGVTCRPLRPPRFHATRRAAPSR